MSARPHTPDAVVTAAMLAREHGLDARTVVAIMERGGVTRTGKGYPYSDACSAIVFDHDPVLTAGHALAGRGNVVLPGTQRYAAARASAEEQRARKLRIDNEVRENRFAPRELVGQQAEHIASIARGQFLSLGNRVAHKLVNCPNAGTIRGILEAEATSILNALSAQLAGLSDLVAAPKVSA